MAQAKRLATNIIFMNKGEILEQSDTNSFFKKPKTDEAFRYIKRKILL